MKDDKRADPRLVRVFVEAAEDLIDRGGSESLHVDGTSNLFSQPEFADHQTLGAVLRVIEKRTPLVSLLRNRGVGEGIVVTIGREVKLEGAEGCSIVSSTYKVGQVEGTIGILGPTRMEYAKLLAIVEYTAKLLSEQMET
jgi:heat-inducible transcriptional repressor